MIKILVWFLVGAAPELLYVCYQSIRGASLPKWAKEHISKNNSY
ncbi:hypothetical protein OM416_19590 [Paenibacillus sp. LS1]|nr:hypothetical protein [Paenibacillus sp. LS1]MCW3793799.1 hypothetical protein [Paenibacillus sp. LS1]